MNRDGLIAALVKRAHITYDAGTTIIAAKDLQINLCLTDFFLDIENSNQSVGNPISAITDTSVGPVAGFNYSQVYFDIYRLSMIEL